MAKTAGVSTTVSDEPHGTPVPKAFLDWKRDMEALGHYFEAVPGGFYYGYEVRPPGGTKG